jgi:hypothetical protein
MSDDFKEAYKKIGDIVKTLSVTTEAAIPREETSNALGYYIPFPKQTTITFLHENGESVWQTLGELPTEIKLCSVCEVDK